MTRKLMLALATAAVVAVASGCKDSSPTPMKFDPAKANYSANQAEYAKGAAAGTAAATTTP
jgi:hypothetical protein